MGLVSMSEPDDADKLVVGGLRSGGAEFDGALAAAKEELRGLLA